MPLLSVRDLSVTFHSGSKGGDSREMVRAHTVQDAGRECN